MVEELPKKFDEVLSSWDCAFKGTDDSDFVVGQVWGRLGADKYLLDQVRGRMNFPTTLVAFRDQAIKWPAARLKLVEDKANGPAVIDTLKHEISGIIAVNPEGGKEARANAVAPQVEAGNIYLPTRAIAPWIDGFVEEHAVFPNGLNDDQVDGTTQALLRFSTGGRASVSPLRL
jgi:predicted phage terminase large subunit-like protein